MEQDTTYRTPLQLCPVCIPPHGVALSLSFALFQLQVFYLSRVGTGDPTVYVWML